MPENSSRAIGPGRRRLHFPVENRFSGFEYAAKLWYDRDCNVLDDFVDRFADVLLGLKAVHVRQPRGDISITEIAIEIAKPDRRVGEPRQDFLGLFLQRPLRHLALSNGVPAAYPDGGLAARAIVIFVI
jgi:hypothetical protein